MLPEAQNALQKVTIGPETSGFGVLRPFPGAPDERDGKGSKNATNLLLLAHFPHRAKV